ncbi:flagellar hook protein FlgE [Sporolituus thermophilus]|uniref:Flagellar hook protein FlgE n=1 Tax=Sporolituus thermophilus DSM 23256 TaxID=1123285 RepID=A0A1G7KPB7_9FIRM|nr:flagellar hook protein FlgE [Sporolituus thermophilus]SDF39062.1 flagellar hook protein FlgE [Sporolituus thermophilus DSM 23256]
MMRSLFAGVSGLRNHQTRMDVIGNNIANVNTIGFKAGRVNFQDILSQTMQGASSGIGNQGGTNPIQVGLGMSIASIDTIFTDGSFQPTGKQTDLSIQGKGFFVLSPDGGKTEVFTRAGNFDFDRLGNFIVPGTGYKVVGWKADSTGNIDTDPSKRTTIDIPVGTQMPAQATKAITFANNLSAEAATGTIVKASYDIYDNVGKRYTLAVEFTKTGDTTWDYTVTDGNGYTVDSASANGTLTFDANTGKLTAPAAPPTITIDYTTPAQTVSGIQLKFDQITQYGGDTTLQIVDQDGYPPGSLEGVTIDPNGVIVGRFSNGKTRNLAQVALATFNNPAGLTKIGDSLYAVSSNSGTAEIGVTGSGGRGKLNPGTLEMSNVDLAQEFSNMIITQRGFQANSKIISVTDEMLQELANLKR